MMKNLKRILLGTMVAVMAGITVPAFGGEFATTTITPANQSGEVGSSFTVDVVFQDDPGSHAVEGIKAWIVFDPTILQATSVTTGAGSPFNNVVTNTIDNTNGLIVYHAMGNGMNGFSITAATVDFTAIAPGTSGIGFSNVDEYIVGYGPFGVNGNASGASIDVVACVPEEQTFTILGANGNIGDIDPYSQSLPTGATEWQPVYLTGFHPWGNITGTNSWVNFDPDDEVGLHTRTPYRIRFEVPADFTDPSMVFQIKADNRALIWINDTFIDSIDGGGNSANQGVITAPADAVVAQALHPGVNEIRLMMVDWGGIVGFNYRVDVTMTSCEDITDAVLTPDEAAELNNAPTADAGADQTSGSTSITLDGSGSSDPDENLLIYSWTLNGNEIATGVDPTISLADGTYTLVLTVSDGELSDTDEVTIVVATNQPPVADAGADQSFDCVIGSTDVTLDGSASSDPDGDALSYSWTLDGTEVSTDAGFSTNLGGGVYAYILTVSDGNVADSDTVSVTVNVDDEAPVITLAGANPDSVVCLYGYADPGASVADNCDADPAMTVTSTVDTSQVGEYTITYSAVDAGGNTAEVVRTVHVINHAPVVDNPVGEVVLSYGTSVLSTTIDLNSVFSDPDAHTLEFSGVIADTSVAGIALAGDQLTITLGSLGSTTVTVTADDGCGGTVEEVFTVTINVTTDLADAVLFSLSRTDLKREVDVASGNVIVNDARSSSNHHDNDDDDDDNDHGDDDDDEDDDDDDDDDNDHGRNGRHGGRDGGNDRGRGGHHDDDDDDDDDNHHHGPAYELTIGNEVTTAGGYSIRANAIRIGRQSQIDGDAYYNVLSNRGTIAGSEFSPLTVPQFVNLPPVAAAAPGTEDVTVRRNQSETLAAGDYDKIEIKQNATLVLTGGVYNVRELKIKQRGSLTVEAGTEIRIQRRLKVDERAYLGPADNASITAADILITVSGEDGHGHHGDDDDNDVTFEHNSTVYANVFAMDSKLSMKNGVEAVGAFWAREIRVHNNVTVTLDSYYSPAAGSMAKMTRSGDSTDADIAVVIPDSYTLHQNYPNPFNPTTTIGYALPEAGTVSLKVYDIRGNLVESLVQGYQTAGMHQVQFGSSQLSSGTYFYILEAGGTRQVKRMAFVK